LLKYPLFCTTIFFASKLKVFSNRLSLVCIMFSFPLYFSRRFSFTLFIEIRKFLDAILHIIKPFSYQKTIQDWFFSCLGRTSLGFLLKTPISSLLAISSFSYTPPNAPYSLLSWIERCGNERSGIFLSWNEFNGNVKELYHCRVKISRKQNTENISKRAIFQIFYLTGIQTNISFIYETNTGITITKDLKKNVSWISLNLTFCDSFNSNWTLMRDSQIIGSRKFPMTNIFISELNSEKVIFQWDKIEAECFQG